MKEILIFAGTTEGRRLSECLAESGVPNTVCVATGYGEIVLGKHPLIRVHSGRMDADEMRSFIAGGNFAAVVDATHPYARAATQNIKAAVGKNDLLYLRLERETEEESDYDKLVMFNSSQSCAEALEQTQGNILLTTGSKELAAFCNSHRLRERLYVRVLPSVESLMLCMEQGITGRQILALQGPFDVRMNEAMLRQYQIQHLVTKKSGKPGGYQEKLEAAKRADIPVYVIGTEREKEGYSFAQICQKLEAVVHQSLKSAEPLEITLAGVGMGSRESLTIEVQEAIRKADIIFGAERMLEGCPSDAEKKPFYTADRIIPCLKEIQQTEDAMVIRRAVVLFSGDSGCYSGCQALYRALQEEIASGGLKASVCIYPGISSVAYLAACAGESYQDAQICSMHGKELPNLAGRIRRAEKTFLLMSGVSDVNRLGQILITAGLEECTVVAGYQLSYEEQRIMKLTASECTNVKDEGLYTCLIINPHVVNQSLTHGRTDAEFIRDRVPMTKEEVRQVSICKLRLRQKAVVYDIGSGTGSVSMEIAGLSDDIQVFAIEQRADAVSLIKKNIQKLMLENVRLVEAAAPEGLEGLPTPTHTFIGGSGGRMKDILAALYELNPRLRVVINAVSVETICELKELLEHYPVEHEEMVQIQVSRTRAAGRYHLMQAENPVWICAFNFREVTEDEA